MKLEIHISEDKLVPAYLQIKYQLAFLIRSGRLVVGARLPAVRSLASTLGISTGTVMKAYAELQAEGYLTGRAGSGTVVASPPPNTGLAQGEARALAEDSLRKAYKYAYALGFGVDELSELAFSLLQRISRVVPLGIVGTTRRMTEKYAQDLAEALDDPTVEIRPITAIPMGETGQQAPGETGKWKLDEDEIAKLDGLYYLVTFTTFVSDLAEALGDEVNRFEILGMSIEPTVDTSRRLSELPPGESTCFVASSNFFHSFVPLIKSQLLSPNTSLHVIPRNQDGLGELERSIEGYDTIVHNVGLTSMLDQLGVPASKRIELEFSFTNASVEDLRTRIATPDAVTKSKLPSNANEPIGKPQDDLVGVTLGHQEEVD